MGSGAPACSEALPRGSSSSLQHADEDRVIIAFDVDCFYAQAEEVRNPALRGRPIGVTQKYLVVTANYPAREAGVGKLMNIAEAKKRCPELVLIPGEDLEPYRAASQSILNVLSRYGPACRLGLDEVFVDVTQHVQSRLASGERPTSFTGHVHMAGSAVAADTQWRPQDLRAVAEGVVVSSATRLKPPSVPLPHSVTTQGIQVAQAAQATAQIGSATGIPETCVTAPQKQQQQLVLQPQEQLQQPAHQPQQPAVQSVAAQGQHTGQHDWQGAWVPLLMLGSLVASEARAAVLTETGFKCSAGIACNKALAKLCSGLHKPNDQTVLPPPEAIPFLSPLHVRVLPGVGRHVEERLHSVGVVTIAQLRNVQPTELQGLVGPRVAAVIAELAWGRDTTPVVAAGPPKAITTEDSFKSCSTLSACQAVMEVLLPDLLSRVDTDTRENRRAPATLTVKWRHRGEGGTRTSASVPWPIPPGTSLTLPMATHATHQSDPAMNASNNTGSVPSCVQLLVQAAMGVMNKRLKGKEFCLTLINVGATNFKPLMDSNSRAAQPLLHRFLLPAKRQHSDTQSAGPSTGGAATNPSNHSHPSHPNTTNAHVTTSQHQTNISQHQTKISHPSHPAITTPHIKTSQHQTTTSQHQFSVSAAHRQENDNDPMSDDGFSEPGETAGHWSEAAPPLTAHAAGPAGQSVLVGAQQGCGGQGVAGSGQGVGCGAAPGAAGAAARLAAERSVVSRRDYGARPAAGVLLSKSEERRLRELRGSVHAAGPSVLAPQHGQGQLQRQYSVALGVGPHAAATQTEAAAQYHNAMPACQTHTPLQSPAPPSSAQAEVAAHAPLPSQPHPSLAQHAVQKHTPHPTHSPTPPTNTAALAMPTPCHASTGSAGVPVVSQAAVRQAGTQGEMPPAAAVMGGVTHGPVCDHDDTDSDSDVSFEFLQHVAVTTAPSPQHYAPDAKGPAQGMASSAPSPHQNAPSTAQPTQAEDTVRNTCEPVPQPGSVSVGVHGGAQSSAGPSQAHTHGEAEGSHTQTPPPQLVDPAQPEPDAAARAEQEARDRELALQLQRQEVEAARAQQRVGSASSMPGAGHVGTGTTQRGSGEAGRGAGMPRARGGSSRRQQPTLHQFFTPTARPP